MVQLLDLPGELLSMIVDRAAEPDSKRNSTLLNLACSCAALKPLALGHLYQNVVILGEAEIFLTFLRRLAEEPAIAPNVLSLTYLEEPDVTWGKGRPPPEGYSKVPHRYIQDTANLVEQLAGVLEVLPTLLETLPESAQSIGHSLRAHNAWLKTMVAREIETRARHLVALSCPNLIDLEFRLLPIPPYMGPPCPLNLDVFGSQWPWSHLESVTIDYGSSLCDQSRYDSVLYGLIDSLRSTSSLKRLVFLHLDATNLKGVLERRCGRQRPLQVSTVELQSDSWAGTWMVFRVFARACRKLEGLRGTFPLCARDQIEYFSLTVKALAERQSGLRFLEIYTGDGQGVQRPTRGLPTHLPEPADLKGLASLERLSIHMVFVFRELFLWSDAELTAIETNQTVGSYGDLSIDYRRTLVDSLPSTLQVLRLATTGRVQRRVVARAIQYLLECRGVKFPHLRRVELDFDYFGVVHLSSAATAAAATGEIVTDSKLLIVQYTH